MRPNATKAKLEDGKVVFGAIVGGFSPDTVELLGAIGYDFVFLDCEHGSISIDQLEQLVRAAEAFDITPIVRVPDHADATILRVLDRGVQGIIVPHVNTPEQAEQVVAAARYYPDGSRGAGGGRAHGYNVDATALESRQWLNEQTLVIPMCEETEAVANIDSILAVPGVDVVHIAAGDLGQSMGNAPRSEVRRVMTDVVGRVRAAGKYAGVGGSSPTDPTGVAELIDAGATFITISAAGLLRVGAELFRAQVEAAAADRG
jgi:2-keto-3-deoxy-L-rhamnonate aldolase RhmA